MMRIAQIFDPATLAELQAGLADPGLFADGRSSAGWHAREVKHDLQARRSRPVERALETIESALLRNEVFAAAARPKAIPRLLISRYEPGMAYGSHVDDALIGGVRTDLAFTLFLADPESFGGGALVIEDACGEQEVKLPAGELFLYPATTLHRVAPVTSGGAPGRGRLGAQLRPRCGPARGAVRPGERGAQRSRQRGQVAPVRHAGQDPHQSAAHVGRRLTLRCPTAGRS